MNINQPVLCKKSVLAVAAAVGFVCTVLSFGGAHASDTNLLRTEGLQKTFPVCYTVPTDQVEGTPATMLSDGSYGYVPHGTQRYIQNVNLNPTCKVVNNQSPTGKELYVPAYSQVEWSNFLASSVTGVTVGDCAQQTTTVCE